MTDYRSENRHYSYAQRYKQAEKTTTTTMIKSILFWTIILLSCDLFGQDKLTYERLDKSDRISIIRLAQKQLNDYLNVIKDSSFDYSLIDTVRIFKNKTDFLIRFSQNIIYVPKDSDFYYGFDVDTINNIVKRILGLNNESISKTIRFFHPTTPDKNKMKFVLKACSIERNEQVTILEKESHFEVLYISGAEKVDKISGKIFDRWSEFLYLDLDKTFNEVKFN